MPKASDGEAQLRRQVMSWLSLRGTVTNHEDKWTQGVFDLSYAANAKDGWIELKHVYDPVSPNDRMPTQLRPGQIAWGQKRIRHSGARYWLLYRVKEKTQIVDMQTFHVLIAFPDWEYVRREKEKGKEDRWYYRDYLDIASKCSVDLPSVLDYLIRF